MTSTRFVFAALVITSVGALAQGSSLDDKAKQLFKPLPKQFDSDKNPITVDKVELGRRLFFEKRLSKNHDVSCNSCHSLSKFGVDGEVTSLGHKKQRGGRNSPTVWNAGNHIAQFWDGRAATLEDQAKGPVMNPVEMAMPAVPQVEALLKSIPEYVAQFGNAFPGEKDPVTFDNMAKAIGAFERTLVSPSRFDAFLTGKSDALTAQEKAGLQTFIDVGCVGCHMGQGVGGAMYQKLGLVSPVPGLKDQGRFDVTKAEADRFMFRVPSLRNVEKTGPYLHDGSINSLEEVVKFMAKHQLGRELKADEVTSIVAFLKALTGELPKAALVEPKAYASSKTTPKPDPN